METLKQFLLNKKLLDEPTISRIEQHSIKTGKSFTSLIYEEPAIETSRLKKAYIQSFKKKTFYEIAKEKGVVPFELLQNLETEFGGIPPNLGTLLVERKHINEEEYARTLAIELSLDYVDLTHYQVDDALFNSIDLVLMRKYWFIPDKKFDREIVLIMANPGNVDEIEELEVRLGLP
ncbi:hypothetical protein HYY75_03575, partial [bacterium]|nr:hypothetical protein [bacterium]